MTLSTSTRRGPRFVPGEARIETARLEGGYLRTDQSSVAFAPQTLPLPANRTPGMEATMPLSIDLAPCLADPLSPPGGGAGADHDDRQLAAVGRVDQLGGELAAFPAGLDRPVRCGLVGDVLAVGPERHGQSTNPVSTANGTDR